MTVAPCADQNLSILTRIYAVGSGLVLTLASPPGEGKLTGRAGTSH